jgi:hypothetical protein
MGHDAGMRDFHDSRVTAACAAALALSVAVACVLRDRIDLWMFAPLAGLAAAVLSVLEWLGRRRARAGMAAEALRRRVEDYHRTEALAPRPARAREQAAP